MGLSIYIHFGLDLSVNVILGLSLGVHPHQFPPLTPLSLASFTLFCVVVVFIHWPKKSSVLGFFLIKKIFICF